MMLRHLSILVNEKLQACGQNSFLFIILTWMEHVLLRILFALSSAINWRINFCFGMSSARANRTLSLVIVYSSDRLHVCLRAVRRLAVGFIFYHTGFKDSLRFFIMYSGSNCYQHNAPCIYQCFAAITCLPNPWIVIRLYARRSIQLGKLLRFTRYPNVHYDALVTDGFYFHMA